MQVFFQRPQGHGRRSRVAIGAQRQINPEHKTVLGGVANQAVDGAHGAAKVLLVGQAAPPVCIGSGLAVLVVHINQIDVTRHIELARAKLAHANDPQLRRLPVRADGRPMLCLQI